MLWSPNIGNGYPFLGSGFESNNPKATDTDPIKQANFQELNTDNVGASAGVITNADDPYGPFYPGDEWVDWVGISVYNIQRNPTTRQTQPVTEDVFLRPNNAESLSGVDAIHNFYQRFVVDKNKPFILSETGSSYVSNQPGGTSIIPDTDPEAAELAVKESWWKAILATSANPAFTGHWHAATWFEEIKDEQSYDDANIYITRDYRITQKEAIRSAFLRDTQAAGDRIKWSTDFKYTCAGTVSLV